MELYQENAELDQNSFALKERHSIYIRERGKTGTALQHITQRNEETM